MIEGLEARSENRIVSSKSVEHVKSFMSHLIAELEKEAPTDASCELATDGISDSCTYPASSNPSAI